MMSRLHMMKILSVSGTFEGAWMEAKGRTENTDTSMRILSTAESWKLPKSLRGDLISPVLLTDGGGRREVCQMPESYKYVVDT